MLGPGLHVVHAMIPFREHMGQPDHRDAAQTQPLPVAVRREMCIQQRCQAHALHMG